MSKWIDEFDECPQCVGGTGTVVSNSKDNVSIECDKCGFKVTARTISRAIELWCVPGKEEE